MPSFIAHMHGNHVTAPRKGELYFFQSWNAVALSVPANLLHRDRLHLAYARAAIAAPAPPERHSQWWPACQHRWKVLRTCGRSSWIRRSYRRRRKGGCIA